ncbi:MAG: hypothetical protein QOG22_2622 [Pseudonocardiales bacterium]|jgi:hypothetical protein|nr:hypothetical protein [Pseudonocardiales bacterium]MDT4983528.1 hypothetical protein [Pseudonocardiales bacterium]
MTFCETSLTLCPVTKATAKAALTNGRPKPSA